MRVEIPHFKTKKERFSYLKKNAKEIISKKKSMPITSDDYSYGCKSISYGKDTNKPNTKTVKVDETLSDNEIKVEVIANLSGWCDSHYDVLISDCWKKTISERGASNKQLIYHLKNHNYSTDAIVGKCVEMSSENIDLSQFNIESQIKTAQALIGCSIVSKKYDKKVFELYYDDEIKQHSIGLRYMKLYLCINSEDEDYKEEKANWDKYYSQVINKDKVDKLGFFWAVTEIKLLEYSAVLFGSNELTTVQSTSKNIEPSSDTQNEHLFII
ncbi:hypothetical protein [Tenacibaculum maritimum]|uniref:hypothetical protein n=1 Tax=Tenacibaculum maritimum TaxID=107401 RepID=UPI0012E59185|nr:hypothetical protein [Tenacibaculum maritimum]CAA0144181.1 conserved hypothetical protein [Tenacibaculum maritimum]CAA0192525.1 conserved hypothetical protein [Tenacibaculum maritimum]